MWDRSKNANDTKETIRKSLGTQNIIYLIGCCVMVSADIRSLSPAFVCQIVNLPTVSPEMPETRPGEKPEGGGMDIRWWYVIIGYDSLPDEERNESNQSRLWKFSNVTNMTVESRSLRTGILKNFGVCQISEFEKWKSESRMHFRGRETDFDFRTP